MLSDEFKLWEGVDAYEVASIFWHILLAKLQSRLSEFNR